MSAEILRKLLLSVDFTEIDEQQNVEIDARQAPRRGNGGSTPPREQKSIADLLDMVEHDDPPKEEARRACAVSELPPLYSEFRETWSARRV